MRTSHKLTRLVLALMSFTALATSLFAQAQFNTSNAGGAATNVVTASTTPVTPPGGTTFGGQNFPSTQPPGFRGNWNNENGLTTTGGLPGGAIVDPPGQIQVSDQKPGSMLVYSYYTSNIQTGADTWVTLTNTSAQYGVLVHVFFMDGASCTQADQFICLTPNASMQLKASEFDPATTRGWVLAVAVDSNGKPAQRNFLIGNAFVTNGAYVGNYGAESFTAYSNAKTIGDPKTPVIFTGVPATAVLNDPACRYDSQGYLSPNGYNGNGYVPGLYDYLGGGATAGLNLTGPPTFCYSKDTLLGTNPLAAGANTDIRTFQLNGGGYDFAPNRFSVEIQSPVDVAGQQIVTVGLSGDLNLAKTGGGAQSGTGVIINGNETPFGSFVNFITGTCQSVGTIDNLNPRVPRGMNTLIPTGQVGTMTFSITAGVGIIMTPRTATKATSGIRTLHKTGLRMNQVTDTSTPIKYEVRTNTTTVAQSNTSILRYGTQLIIPVYLPPSCKPTLD
ncbi:MAG: hypothetical protein U0Y68_04940 [Blastocatellia bacterium]